MDTDKSDDSSDFFTKWTKEEILGAAETKSPTLNLMDMERRFFPDGVLDLSHLENLNLAGNEITSLPPLDRLPLLKRLDLRRNPIERITSRPGLLLDWSSYVRVENSIDPTHIVGLGFDVSSGIPDISLNQFPNLVAISFDPDKPPLPRKNRVAASAPLKKRTRRRITEQCRIAIRRLLVDAPALEELDFFYIPLEGILDSIPLLSNLSVLNLRGGSIRALPAGFSQLSRLRSLSLSDNLIEVLPDWLWTLTDLESLDIAYNQLGMVPSGIGKLRNLLSVSLRANQLDALPNTISNLTQLRSLNLSDNLFASIPSSLFNVETLERLDLSAYQGSSTIWNRGNQEIKGTKSHTPVLTEVPRDIVRLSQLKNFLITGQPIATPPAEVAKQGINAIKDYWRQREDVGTDYLCEAKLLIVGEPGAGKTTLAHKLLDASYPLDAAQSSTEGIDILRWQFPTTLRPKDGGPSRSLTRTFRVSIWDFGGQEIYHSTHQFFLTRRSVYLLVADSRKEDTDFQYWLNIVELLSDRSPLVIVKNEKQDRRRDIDDSGLRGRFKSLREVIAVNFEGNRGLEDLSSRIKQHLEALPHIGEALPVTWKRVREALEQDPRNYISAEEYLRICEVNGFTRLGDKLQLSGYLHDLGICLHFQDDHVLKNTVILKPKWGTDAVYRVLDDASVIDQRGRFSRAKLDLIWSENEYASMRDELLHLMVRFQLCYQLENSDVYVAPQLLTPERPSYAWTYPKSLTLKYRYDFMPKGIFTRLIVALNHLIVDQSLVWRTGAVLERDGTRCEVIEDNSRREIRVRAAGRYPRELIAIVDFELGRIHGSFQHFKCETWVPCQCSSCNLSVEPQLYPFEVLRRFARDEKSIQCHASYELVDARELVDAVFSDVGNRAITQSTMEERVESNRENATESSRRSSAEVFVSYGWTDESNALVDELSAAFETRGVSLIRDKDEMKYKDSLRRFMRRIGRGNAIVVVLSRKYLESPNCMFELAEIADRPDFRDRVFPIILPDARVFEAEVLIDYIKYWEDRVKSLDEKMRTVELTNLQGVQDDINLFRRIRNVIAQLVDILRDMNVLSVRSNRELLIDKVVKAVEKKLGISSAAP